MAKGDISILGLSKTFPSGFRALHDVTLRFPPGKLTSLLGPSGCGKTTLMRLIAGLDVPSVGRIEINGENMASVPTEARPISMVFQDYALFPHLDVLENISFGIDRSITGNEDPRKLATAALDLVGLHGHGDSIVSQLSGGQQQRVALARALAVRPDVLLLDEPLSNLDAGLRRSIREDIRELQRNLGLTVVYVTHDQTEAMAVSDFIALMKGGRILQRGMPAEIYEHPRDEFVASFMGDASVFDVQTSSDGCVRLGCLTVQQDEWRRQGRFRLVVRPHAWRIDAATGEGMPGRIVSRAYLGRVTEYTVWTELGALLVVTPNESFPRQVGAPVSLFLRSRGVSLLLPNSAPPESPRVASNVDTSHPPLNHSNH